ncbi:MAG: hypothetical protein QNK04_17145 [Myxococcota bacterium]|nr:hypothetical protein [Myxococcota bacterium]
MTHEKPPLGRRERRKQEVRERLMESAMKRFVRRDFVSPPPRRRRARS